MMSVSVDMPEVSACNEKQCAYNIKNSCHARAITVGDGNNPNCDTFFSSTTHCHDSSQKAGVGACKVSACHHNDDFECQAHAIRVGMVAGKAICLTCSM